MKTVKIMSIRTALLALSCLFLSTGCQKTNGELQIIPNGEISLVADGETKNVIVIANSGWNVSVKGNDGGWLDYKTTDKNVSFTAGANTNLDVRTATVTIALKDKSASEELTIRQNAKPQTIILSPGSILTVPKEGAEYNVVVTYSEFVELKITDNLDWVDPGTLSGSGGTLKVTVEPNPGATARSGSIVFADNKGNASSAALVISQAGDEPIIDPNSPLLRGYTLTSEMRPNPAHVGLGFADQVWNSVHSDMLKYGWNYSEHPNHSRSIGDHNTETHIAVEWDEELGQNVYHLFSHSRPGAVDGDRGPAVGGDRMRNEMKSETTQEWRKINGNYDEWQILEWKMKIPTGWAPTTSFCHIHQLKGQEGDDIGSPVITISLRADSGGGGRRLEVIHTPRRGGVSKGKIVNDKTLYALEKFEGEWLQVQTEANFKRDGYYKVKITKIKDGTVLVNKEVYDIDLWRLDGCINIRNKFGIYRDYNISGNLVEGQQPNLKDESIYLADFKAYEKNANNTGAGPVND